MTNFKAQLNFLFAGGTVYLVSKHSGFIQPIPLRLYMSRLITAGKLSGWIPKATEDGAKSLAKRYIKN